MREATGCAASTVFVVDPTTRCGRSTARGRRAAGRGDPAPRRRPHARGGGRAAARRPQMLGYCVLVGVPRWTAELDERAQRGGRRVRRPPRHRGAVRRGAHAGDLRGAQPDRPRDARRRGAGDRRARLHRRRDRVDQRPRARPASWPSTLRAEITRLVSEIRFSIFDLRHQVTDGRLSGSLADYAREVSHATGLRVHLSLAESGPPLSAAHGHRGAARGAGGHRQRPQARRRQQPVGHLRLRRDDPRACEVEDDGVGNAGPREHHWGLQTHARARRGRRRPTSTCRPRPDGGTVVSLRSPTTADSHRRRTPMGTTVLLVDDHELIRQGLARAFERDDGHDRRRARPAASPRASRRGEELSPTSSSPTCSCPTATGSTSSAPSAHAATPTGVVVLTMHAGDDQIFAAMEAGASAFVGKDTRATEVVSAAKHAAVAPRTFLCAGLSAGRDAPRDHARAAQAVRPRGRGPRAARRRSGHRRDRRRRST